MKIHIKATEPGNQSAGHDLVSLSTEGDITFNDFDTGSENPLDTVLGDTWREKRLLLDLDRTNFIDSRGIGWLVQCHSGCKNGGGSFVIHSLTPSVRQVLELLKLPRVLAIARTETEARTLIAAAKEPS
jgi:anti-anti-sigma factor